MSVVCDVAHGFRTPNCRSARRLVPSLLPRQPVHECPACHAACFGQCSLTMLGLMLSQILLRRAFSSSSAACVRSLRHCRGLASLWDLAALRNLRPMVGLPSVFHAFHLLQAMAWASQFRTLQFSKESSLCSPSSFTGLVDTSFFNTFIFSWRLPWSECIRVSQVSNDSHLRIIVRRYLLCFATSRLPALRLRGLRTPPTTQ